jgi:hypothetical protein
VAEVRMSLEEYNALLAGQGPILLSSKEPGKRLVPRKATRKGTPDPKMSRALVKANKMGRKKAGGYKKGWNQGKIMRKAHQLRRKM